MNGSEVEEVRVGAATPAVRGTILHITTVPSSLLFVRGQAGYMLDRGWRVWALSSPGPELEAFRDREGVPVLSVQMLRRISPVHDLAALWSLYREIRRLRPDIVHAHTPKGGLLGILAGSLVGCPIRIYHLRGLPLLTSSGVRRALLTWSERVACGLAHQVICVSRSVREVAVAQGLCRENRIKVLLGGSGNGVDALARFNPEGLAGLERSAVRRRYGIPDEAMVLGFVGRIVRDKGITELVEAWQELRAEFDHLRLLVVGPFEAQDPVPPEVAEVLRSDPHIHLTGTDWNTPPLYAAMDLVALPTYREGFPNVPLEAAAMALPVVATWVPGCIDAVADGVTGTLVPARDPGALAHAIRTYVMDPELRRTHGAAGRDRVVREFRQEAIWEALHLEYERLLARTHSIPPTP